MESPIRFWQGMTKAAGIDQLDKFMVGKNSDGSTKYADIIQLLRMLTTLGGSSFKGSIKPTDSPVVTTDQVFYIASPGVYANFGGITVTGLAGIVGQKGTEFTVTNLNADLGVYDRASSLSVVASVLGSEPNFDFLGGSIIFYKGTEYIPTVRKNSNFYEQPSTVVLEMPDGFLGYVLLNKLTRLPEVYSILHPNINQILSDDNLILFCNYFRNAKTISMNGSYKINSNLFGIDFQAYTLLHARNDVFNFDIANRKIYFPKSLFILKNKVGVLDDINQTITNCPPLTIPAGEGYHFLLFNTVLVNFRLIYFDNLAAIEEVRGDYRYIFIGYVYPGGDNAFIQGDFKINGVGSNGVDRFDPIADRFMYTRDMFLFDEDKLPLFKGGLFRTHSSGSKTNVTLFTHDLTNPTGDYKRFEVSEPLLINASEVGNFGNIIVEPNVNPGEVYLKKFNIHKVSRLKFILNPVEVYLSWFADSLGQGNAGLLTSPAYQLKKRLALMGINVKLTGSFNLESPDVNAPDGIYMAEARGYWQYKNFVGRNNAPYGQVITPKLSGRGSTKFQNPFLKLANATDKANHPNWCFRNTGSQNEKSYQEDQDKTGDFYIFDYLNYLGNQQFFAPNISVIALGTNDWQEYTSGGTNSYDLNQSVQALEIMITKMREASVNMKIIIVPANALSISRAEWETYFFPLMEAVVSMVEYKFANDPLVYLCPIYAHASRFGAYHSTSAESYLSGNNNTLKTTRSSDVHALDIVNGEGMDAYMKAIMPAVTFCI
ncbi:SGNH/GDSL hydrolase family protein [Pedobacter agri]|uniref:SGNH/GDSL hydrolase family protein n=1 Tax=Pedobacter agri TaxID=454586 RepID=UPI00292D9743|nr:SGNH/GDSL hydrolase family protein [Pedobacter agri]